MTAPTHTDLDDLGIPEGSSGYDGPLEGMYAATLVRMEKARRPDAPNKFGKQPLTSKFVWVIDGYDHEIWDFPNVEARGELARFHHIFKAITGKPLTAATPLEEIYALRNRRCNIIIEESNSRPGFPRIKGYARLAPARPQPQRPAPPPPQDDEFGDIPF